MSVVLEAVQRIVTVALVNHRLNFQTSVIHDQDHDEWVRNWKFTFSPPNKPETPIIIVAAESMLTASVALSVKGLNDELYRGALDIIVQKVPFTRLVRIGDPHPVWIRTEVPIDQNPDFPLTEASVTAAWESVLTAAQVLVEELPGRFELQEAQVIPVMRREPSPQPN